MLKMSRTVHFYIIIKYCIHKYHKYGFRLFIFFHRREGMKTILIVIYFTNQKLTWLLNLSLRIYI